MWMICKTKSNGKIFDTGVVPIENSLMLNDKVNSNLDRVRAKQPNVTVTSFWGLVLLFIDLGRCALSDISV